MKYLVFVIVWLAYVMPLKAQGKYAPNGWYITKAGDTIHGSLRIKDSMYLIARNAKGKKKSLTPSRVKEVRIGSSTYVPMYLKEFDKLRFVSLRIKGKCSLYVFEDALKTSYPPGIGVIPAMVIAGTEASFRVNNSGAYLKFENDEKYYSVPLYRKQFNKFIIYYFSDNQEILSRLDEEWDEMIPFLAGLILDFNKQIENQEMQF